MKTIEIKEMQNGWIVTVDGFSYYEGSYVYKLTESISFIEFIGELIADGKVKVAYK